MKKLFYTFLCMCNLLYMMDLSASATFISNTEYEEDYKWRASDASQKKQAVGMVVSGAFFFVAIALISGLIPPCAGPTVPLSDIQNGNTILD